MPNEVPNLKRRVFELECKVSDLEKVLEQVKAAYNSHFHDKQDYAPIWKTLVLPLKEAET